MGLFKRIKQFFAGSVEETETVLESFDGEYTGEESELSHHLSQIVDATFEMEDLKREYELVTSYFSDIQRIEQMGSGLRRKVEDDTRKILMLEENRRDFQQRTERLSADVYARTARHAEEIPEAIERLDELEDMRGKIRRDLEYLEGEKGAIDYAVEHQTDRMKKLRTIGLIVGILTVMVIAFLILLQLQTEDGVYVIAWVSVAFLSLIIEFIVFLAHNSTDREIKYNGLKKNRAIKLQNKVKIKWLNNINNLDFLYAKFEVNSAKELAYTWEQYRAMVEEEKQYQKNTGDLYVYQQELLRELKEAGVRDCDLWLSQIHALIDSREMVEVKHALNVRRQKLRDQMKVNEEVRQNSLVCVKAILTEHPDFKDQAREVLSSYHIAV